MERTALGVVMTRVGSLDRQDFDNINVHEAPSIQKTSTIGRPRRLFWTWRSVGVRGLSGPS
jgi:hypothetical protein